MHAIPRPRGSRLVRFSALFLLAGMVTLHVGCGDARDKALIKQAKAALAGGDPQGAARQTKDVLQRSPRNISALRMLRKVKGHLLKKADQEIRAKNYQSALDNLQTLLEMEPDHAKAQALQVIAKKHKHVARAREAQANREIGTALEEARIALQADATFDEALELMETLMEQRDDEVARLLAHAPDLLQGDEAQTVIREMQQVLKMDESNAKAQEYLREAQVSLLAQQKKENLEAARAFYAEGRYEAAIEKADAILAVDPTSFEAKQLKERAAAESQRPAVVLTGISVIAGVPVAAIELPSLGERKMLRTGSEIGPYRAVKISMADKTVSLEYIPTGSILPYTTVRE